VTVRREGLRGEGVRREDVRGEGVPGDGVWSGAPAGPEAGAGGLGGGAGVPLGIEGVTVEVAGRRIVEDVRLAVADGAFVGLVGPNGSGKSTLLRCVYRALRPASGVVRIGGDDAHALPAREAARLVAALPQESASEFDFTVAEVVGMGRLPHRERTAAGDREICAEAMARTGVAHLAERGFLGLSGGEKQRVLIARALAQRPRVLVLDEPTNHLDIAHQLDVLSLVQGSGLTVLAALHDLNLAAAYCDVLYVLDGGRVVTSGAPHDVLRPELLAEVFGVRAHPVRHPETGATQLLFDRLPRSTNTRPTAARPTDTRPTDTRSTGRHPAPLSHPHPHPHPHP
jgi:iron complex transport system ATP-binding protein